MLYLGTNNMINEPSKVVPRKLLDLNKFIENTLLKRNNVISNLIT